MLVINGFEALRHPEMEAGDLKVPSMPGTVAGR